MAAVATPSFVDAQKVLVTWATADGRTDAEKIKFADDALALLADDNQAAKFANNVKQVGTWANQIDASFDRVGRSFDDLVAKYGNDFPGFAGHNTEWKGYNARWVFHLALSCDVASEHVTILRRFDQVFLDMVESIATDQARKDVIVELQFIVSKAHDLLGKQNELGGVNRKQEALAHLQSDFDGVKPDIALIYEKLVLFEEIWSSVRSQTVQFQDHLKGGMEAITNLRFKKEVCLAREMCTPLQAGLAKYAVELENRK